MSNLRASFEKIDEYLNGELSGQELVEFKEMMEKHESLAEEVQLQQLANEAIVELNLANLRKDIKRISLKERTASRFKLYGSLAAAAILISGIAYFALSPKAEEFEAANVIPVNPSSKEAPISRNAELPVKAEVTPAEIVTQQQKNIEQIAQNEPAATFDSQRLPDSTLQHTETIPYSNSDNLVIGQKSEQVKEKNTDQNSTTVPCKANAIDAFIHIEPACKDQKGSGKITIDLATVKGGKPDYKFSLNGGADYQEFPVFEELASGPAQLLIKDAQGCISRKDLTIPEKNCFKEVIIYPLKGETWTAPIVSKENVITIKDIQGKILFENSYSDSDNFTWDGKTNDGQDLPMGQYYYTIKGDKGNIINGYISIPR
ncbi:FlgD immunoglobulin-like domain containing protein [Sporocytophaga myxococcoides]|uniref:FlgD immunoglobulin-like domain containing protein n=1 Tax=Sporocytophaga myxococcoides TaxID=153721 RepID=UPI00040A07BB|nr:FlgD immunoglobulin-like domain containing protein [Sporocytophaga myxococcoides]